MDRPQNVKDLARKVKDNLSFSREVRGMDFEKEWDFMAIMRSFETMGFQGSNLYRAVEEIERMKNSKIFFGCTSNIISSGLRDVIATLVKRRHVHVLVITGGGIEEDIIKAFKPTFCADFRLDGAELRDNGLNRIGNLVIPSENYEHLESWLNNIVNDITEGYTAERPRILTPSSFIRILGERIDDESSILYWAAKNDIPVYSPAVVDGSLGDILSFHPRRKMLKLDIVEDVYRINCETIFCGETAAIILGCGVVKHHILNANLFKNGLEHCVLINNAQEFDGSDAGASLDEAVSWGKVKPGTRGVKVFGDATILFPLLVGATFMRKDKDVPKGE
ncbi:DEOXYHYPUSINE SYNTHASE [Encephalitozoon cuniculi GB-M1]|uniref:Deoxyhypusine synthase n=2 Tax=Encephalitozoon cuniculi TaxID=6035 RepID=DHYS_ENCCU|nr:deoxyhypusine synthase [Encephalitozoon cuniculi GB-M1]Q8SQN2.2 RecName: Full=Deoxyhypusine synthase; Short=DHS [Encephalitozoon cuniculi GB-M1]KMV65454.1 deoxyhypusine synthase [Encephalitozoon cuniculi EcunIII-L]UYI26777.1 deoxyhypusine synthase [Encephalitozoon cuniculi]CAD27064.2 DEOXYHYPUSINE SYNTHASE [Encephalitozoon cuniculi GB-M1]